VVYGSGLDIKKMIRFEEKRESGSLERENENRFWEREKLRSGF